MSTYSVRFEVSGGAVIPEALNHLSVRVGSRNALDPAEPSEATFSFDRQPYIVYTEWDGSTAYYYLPANWWVGQTVSIYVQRSGATSETKIFEGLVDQVNYTNQGPSEDSPLVEVHAAGYLAALGRFPIYQTFPAQNETQRILAIYTALGTLWYMCPSDVTWADVPTSPLDTTWADFDANRFRPAINSSNWTPYALEETTYDGASAQDILQEMALGLSAYLNDQLGNVVYKNFNSLSGGNYINYSIANIAYEPDFIGSAGINDLYNSVTYENSTASATDSDLASWNDWSLRPITVPTLMSSYTDMQQMAQRKLQYLSNQTNNYLNELRINYDAIGTPIWQLLPYRFTFTDMPWTQKYGPNSQYVMRGLQLDITYQHAEATWILASSQIWDALTAWRNIGVMDWASYPALTTWNGVN